MREVMWRSSLHTGGYSGWLLARLPVGLSLCGSSPVFWWWDGRIGEFLVEDTGGLGNGTRMDFNGKMGSLCGDAVSAAIMGGGRLSFLFSVFSRGSQIM